MSNPFAAKILAFFIAFSILSISRITLAQDSKMVAGADISMLPEIEKAGGIFRKSDGSAGDAIQILRDHDFRLFRLRLFVDPTTDFARSYGATQDLKYVRALAKRIKAAGGQLLLDIHYSDTWADPAKQFTPAKWKQLDFDALEKQVHDYTAAVLKDLQDNGASPEMVQVGNEITGGMLWPLGKVLDASPDQEAAQWQRFAKLLNAGAKAVREAQTPGHPIRIMIHIHGGGKPGMAKWFFEKLGHTPVDFDIVGLSFYPAWGDAMDALKQNIDDVITSVDKDVFIAETSYPWRPLPDIKESPIMRWPQTPAGQKQFLEELLALMDAAPNHRAIGYAWWYPEAIAVPPLHIWRNGSEALFDDTGKPLPAMDSAAKPAGKIK